ncbi:hypothetical protein [Leptothrix ochracea]|uniref:hypothetical protein n=1 Tax=Leptothrix ochracea TaxID=735331 RepID=UPI0034E2AE1B
MASKLLCTVAVVVDDWQPAFRAAGVSPTDIAQLAEQLDRPFLRAQRVRPHHLSSGPL